MGGMTSQTIALGAPVRVAINDPANLHTDRAVKVPGTVTGYPVTAPTGAVVRYAVTLADGTEVVAHPHDVSEV